MKRITKDEYFLSIANIVATRATCDRLWVGCVLVKDGEILATGYNGAPSGLAECDEVGHLLVRGDDEKDHCVRTVHAEQNAIYQARNRVANLSGVTAYVSTTPCETCLSELLHCGIKRVICGSVYRNAKGAETTARLASAWSAIVEYRPMPDITLRFGTEVSDVKRTKIERTNG